MKGDYDRDREDEIRALAAARLNDAGQPIGWPVSEWAGRPRPGGWILDGHLVYLEPMDADRHAADLFAAQCAEQAGAGWAYLRYGPFADAAAHRVWLEGFCLGAEPLFLTVVDRKSGRAVGQASYLRIDPANGSIEIGHIHFAPALQRTRAATEALVLMMAHVMDDLGYRRCEWKCNALNAPSRAAARRLGFQYEGTFHQLEVVDGCNRDTAWYSIVDGEWPALKAAYTAWLDAANFGADGRQRQRLSAMTARAHQTLSR